jgi:hypothetical protein
LIFDLSFFGADDDVFIIDLESELLAIVALIDYDVCLWIDVA